MPVPSDQYPPAYDKHNGNRKIDNVPDSWLARWPERYVRELGTKTKAATTNDTKE